MNTKLSCLFVALILAAIPRLMAQSCFSYTDDYATYTSESTDGSYIYTSVLVDGSGTMTLNTGSGCDFNYSNAVHTPIAVNVLVDPSGSPVGGSVAGQPECPNCYLSVTNNQSIAAVPGQNYTFNWSGQVNCSYGGNIFGTGGYIGIAIAVTTYKLVTVTSDGGGDFVQACPGTTRATCGAQNIHGREPTIWLEEFQLRVTVGGSLPYCIQPGIVQYFNGEPAPYPCT